MPGVSSRGRVLLAGLCALILAPLLAGAAEITHFDLRQEGAATLVTVTGRNGTTRHILIDTGRAGSGDRGAALVRDELAKRGVTRLDLVILTHLDADHAEGTFTLLGTTRAKAGVHDTAGKPVRGPPLAIGRILLPADTLPQHERFRDDLVAAATTAGAEVVSPTPEVLLDIEGQYDVTVLVPAHKPNARPNETSLVIVGYDRAKDTAFMLTGDIPAGMVRTMLARLPNHVNVLQAPHHGADQGLLDLVAKTNPDYIVISADNGNRYAHPRLSILRSLAAIRPPPTGLDVLLASAYGPEQDRFHAATLAREVDHRITRAVRYLKDPNPLGSFRLPNDPLRPDTLDLLSSLSTSVKRVFSKPVDYDQVLITGERGNLAFVDGKFSGETDPDTALFMSLVWHELPHVTDPELRQLRDWREAQAYLSIVAAGRESSATDAGMGNGYVSAPPKRATKETFVHTFDSALEVRRMKRSRVLELGRSRVTAARWTQLVRMCSAQSVAEREAALRAVRESFLRSVLSIPRLSEGELSLLMAAAVADYETGAGNTNIEHVIQSINGARERAYSDALGRASAKIRAQVESAQPKIKSGWLQPALRQLGLPEGVAAFSGALLEAAAERRLLLP